MHKCHKSTPHPCSLAGFPYRIAIVSHVPFAPVRQGVSRSFELLLGPKLVGVAAFLLAAVDGTWGKASVALAADPAFTLTHLHCGGGWRRLNAHLVAVVLGGEGLERGLDDTTAQTEDEMQCRLLLDVVVGEGATVLELLAGEDQALLVRRDAFLVLDLRLDIV